MNKTTVYIVLNQYNQLVASAYIPEGQTFHCEPEILGGPITSIESREVNRRLTETTVWISMEDDDDTANQEPVETPAMGTPEEEDAFITFTLGGQPIN